MNAARKAGEEAARRLVEKQMMEEAKTEAPEDSEILDVPSIDVKRLSLAQRKEEMDKRREEEKAVQAEREVQRRALEEEVQRRLRQAGSKQWAATRRKVALGARIEHLAKEADHFVEYRKRAIASQQGNWRRLYPTTNKVRAQRTPRGVHTRPARRATAADTNADPTLRYDKPHTIWHYVDTYTGVVDPAQGGPVKAEVIDSTEAIPQHEKSQLGAAVAEHWRYLHSDEPEVPQPIKFGRFSQVHGRNRRR